MLVGPGHAAPLTFNVLEPSAKRSAWSDSGATSPQKLPYQMPFRQGADLMPRTAVFQQLQQTASGRWTVAPIDLGTGAERYLWDQAKLMPNFRVSPSSVGGSYVFDAFLSAHLVPFHVAAPAKALLPIDPPP